MAKRNEVQSLGTVTKQLTSGLFLTSRGDKIAIRSELGDKVYRVGRRIEVVPKSAKEDCWAAELKRQQKEREDELKSQQTNLPTDLTPKNDSEQSSKKEQ